MQQAGGPGSMPVVEPHTPEQMLAQAQTMPLLAPAGTAFAFSSMNDTLLAMIIQQVSGERYDAGLVASYAE